jgi:hypothetical protein
MKWVAQLAGNMAFLKRFSRGHEDAPRNQDIEDVGYEAYCQNQEVFSSGVKSPEHNKSISRKSVRR